MAISVLTPDSSETGGNPGNLAYDNQGGFLVAFVSGRNSSTGITPSPESAGAVYHSVAMTLRHIAKWGGVASAIWELESPYTGVNTYDPDGTKCTYSTWGALGLDGASSAEAYLDGDGNTGQDNTPTLDGPIVTAKGGIIVAICSRQGATAITIPEGWTVIYYETESGGGAGKAAYKLTDGTPINPAYSLGSSSYRWALSVASYKPPSVGSKMILSM